MRTFLKTTTRAMLMLAFGVFSATAAEVTVQNTSTDNVKLYSSDGHGWSYEGTIRAGSRVQRFQTHVGDDWGFADPHSSRVQIIKQISVRSRGSNTLVLTDRDHGHGGGPPPILQKRITVTNYSSEPVGVYADHGRGWHYEDLFPAGGKKSWDVDNGDDWGIDDPFKGGANIIKHLKINSWDPLPAMTINDSELGIKPKPIVPQQRTIHVSNKSNESHKLYLDEGRGYKYIDTVRANASEQFKAQIGDSWAFDDPHKSGFNSVKELTITSFGSTYLAVTDRDVHGGGIFNPGLPPAAKQVSITFKNQGIHKANVSRKKGAFSKTFIDKIGPWGSKTFNLNPGETIVLNRPDELRALKFTVPSRSQTFPFKL
ncbi:MAG: hypothetical protein ACKVJU_21295 [Verrucomicrobiales bacterium]